MITMDTMVKVDACGKVRKIQDASEWEFELKMKADIPTEKLMSVPGIGAGLTALMKAQDDDEARGLNLPVTTKLGSADYTFDEELAFRAEPKGNPSIWVTDTDARIQWRVIVRLGKSQSWALMQHLDGEFAECSIENVQSELDLAAA